MQYRGVDGGLPPHESMASMADELIQHIREVQPHGPYYLVGWSFGGMVVFEMACQLQRDGERVAVVAMLDTIAPGLLCLNGISPVKT